MQIQHRLAPFTWYQSGAEDAVAHYLKVFGADQGRVTHTQRWGENAQALPARSCCSTSSCSVCR
jgi:predicted 3-demethylubiquinone-9 3-methyltransferase (glyoxalase superfamily)